MTILAALLFGAAFIASLWTMFATVRAQLPRMRELLRQVPPAELPLAPSRITIRWQAPSRPVSRLPLRAAA